MFFYCNPNWIEEICDTPAKLLASHDPIGACFDEAWQTSRRKGSEFPERVMCNDFHSRHSLSAGGPPSAVRLRGLPWPRFSRRSLLPYVPINRNYFLRNIVAKLALLLQFVYSLAVSSIFWKKEFRIALAPNQDFKIKLEYLSCFLLVYTDETLTRLKRFATLLPKYCLPRPHRRLR